jgi:hypothetical protein
MQDVVVQLVGHGFDLDFLLDIDLLSFDAIVASYTRTTVSNKVESAWTSMLAAQGTSKDMKKWTKHWEGLVPGRPETRSAKSGDDFGKFIGKFGGGL